MVWDWKLRTFLTVKFWALAAALEAWWRSWLATLGSIESTQTQVSPFDYEAAESQRNPAGDLGSVVCLPYLVTPPSLFLMRFRVLSQDPLPAVRIWFSIPDTSALPLTVSSLKSQLCTQIPEFQRAGLSHDKVVLAIDGFSLLDHAPADIIKENDLVWYVRYFFVSLYMFHVFPAFCRLLKAQ